MGGPEARGAWLRGQVLLVLLVPALAGLGSQPTGTLVAAGAFALVAAAVAVLVTLPPALTVGLVEARLRAWGREQGHIERAETPDRPGPHRPRAPGAGSAAPVR
jgi:hypothetical protein